MANSETGTAVWPLVPYADQRAGIRFLTEALSFTESVIVPGEDGTVLHAELRWPQGGGVMLGTVDPDNPFAQPKGSGMLYLWTPEPDGLFDRAVGYGAEAVREPQDQSYGSREAVVRDPEGNTFSFGTYAGS